MLTEIKKKIESLSAIERFYWSIIIVLLIVFCILMELIGIPFELAMLIGIGAVGFIYSYSHILRGGRDN